MTTATTTDTATLPRLSREVMETKVIKPTLSNYARTLKCTKMAKAADVDPTVGNVYVQLPCGRLPMRKLFDHNGYSVWYGVYMSTFYWAMGDTQEQ